MGILIDWMDVFDAEGEAKAATLICNTFILLSLTTLLNQLVAWGKAMKTVRGNG